MEEAEHAVLQAIASRPGTEAADQHENGEG